MDGLGKRVRSEPPARSPIAARTKRSKSELAEEKAQKYEVVSSFFRVYLVQDGGSAVLKNAVFNLYSLKVPRHHQLARNALFRHMWTRYTGTIAVHQSHYKEYIKGLKMRTAEQQCTYPQFEADKALLRSFGIEALFGFTEEDLATSPIAHKTVEPKQTPLQQRVEELEEMAKNLLDAVVDIKRAIQEANTVD